MRKLFFSKEVIDVFAPEYSVLSYNFTCSYFLKFTFLIAAEEQGISIRIAQNDQPNKDTEDLSKVPGIKVRALNFKNLIGAGILHTKLWISDK